MKQLLVGLGLALSFSACGGSLCDRLANPDTSKKGTCQNVSITAYDKAKCDAAVMTDCNQGDQKAIGEFLDCVDQLPACTPETESNFTSSLIGCAGKIATISTKCQEALAAAK